jgi:hypothetical protein
MSVEVLRLSSRIFRDSASERNPLMKVAPPGSGISQAGGAHAGDLFTDRDVESTAFKAALATFRRLLDADQHAGVARRNVLMFHGVGGIGKTALSVRLEAWTKHAFPSDASWGPPPSTKIAAMARIDLHGSAGQMDLAAALIALRAGVARIRGRWPVFDLAFAAYWSAVRPGEPLPTFQGRDELGSAVAETIGDVLGDLGSLADLTGVGTGTGIGIRAIRKLIGEIRRRRDLRLALDAFEGFENFLMRCADEPSPTNPHFMLVCEIAGTLSWELSRLTPCPLVVVFLDTTERLTLDTRRISEGYVNALVYQMPNVLFVMSGRNKLDWYEETRSDLPYRGSWTWPGLPPSAQEEPRQHLIGNLSPHDARTMIARGRDQLDLPISDQVIEELVVASAGLPQYLELARQVAISIASAGDRRQVTAADVTGSLGSLVKRVLDDIPADEQRAIRAAALFRAFGIDLMAAAADVDYGCAERAARRPMIECYVGESFPYRMHDAIRDAIRRSDHEVTGGWSERDWQFAASRAVAAAHRLHDDAKAREANRDVLDAIGVAIGLVCDQETMLEPSPSSAYVDWLTRAIVYGPSIQGLRPRIPTTSKTEYGRHVLDFITAKSIDTPIEDRIRLLRAIFNSDHPLRLPAGRHLGYTLKLQHRWDDALTVFDEVVRLEPTAINIGQRPQVLSLARRFIEARDAADGTSTSTLIRRVAEYAHGRPERYFDEIPAKITKLRKQGRQREVLEEKGDLLMRRVFYQEATTLDAAEINAYFEEAELAGHIAATRKALLATILQREAEPAELAVALERLKSLDQASEAAGVVGFHYAIAETCDALINGPDNRLQKLRQEIEEVDFRSRSWIPIECFLDLAGLPLTPTPTQWLEPYDLVLERWRGHLNRYLTRQGATPIGQWRSPDPKPS